jgi:hypothetical protein
MFVHMQAVPSNRLEQMHALLPEGKASVQSAGSGSGSSSQRQAGKQRALVSVSLSVCCAWVVLCGLLLSGVGLACFHVKLNNHVII